MNKRLLSLAFTFVGFFFCISHANAAASPFFTRTLKLRSIGADVQALQIYLNAQAFFITKHGPGSPGHETIYFGPATRNALIAFQNFHASDILAPFKLKQGTGILSTATRTFINAALRVTTLKSAVPSISSTLSPRYTVGGSITGVSGTVVLQNNQDDVITIQPGANSHFVFPKKLVDGQSYNVTLQQVPTGSHCFTSDHGTGVNIVGSIQGKDVDNIVIQCSMGQNPFQSHSGGSRDDSGDTTFHTYTVGGSISHLTSPIVLQTSEDATLTVSASGEFHFSSFRSGQDYAISILTQPAGEVCSLSHGSGTVTDADVTSIVVTCLTITTLHTTNITVENAEVEQVISPAISSYVSSTSPGPFVYSVDGASALLIDGELIIASLDATSTINVSQEEYGDYTAATGSLTFIAHPTPTPTITDFSPITKNYGDAPFVLSAHSNSEGALTYMIDDADIATVSGTTVTLHGIGLTTIHLQQAPWGIYTATTTRTAVLTVNPVAPSVTFDDVTKEYDGNSFSLDPYVTSTSHGLFSFISSNPDVISISGDSATILASGTSTISVMQEADGNYTSTTASALFTIPETCAENACGIYSTSCSIDTHGAACHCMTGVTGSLCNIGINACATIPCGVHGLCTRVSTLLGISPPLNSYTCTCDLGYYGSTCALDTPPLVPDMTFYPIIKYLGDTAFELTVTSTSSGVLSFVSSNLSVASVSSNMCTITGVGTSTITAYQSAQGDTYSSSTTSTLMTVYANYCTAHGNPCQNGGACSPYQESFQCTCAPSFSGELCENSTLSCDGSADGPTCQNGGACTANASGGECACLPCYIGAYCENFDPECA